MWDYFLIMSVLFGIYLWARLAFASAVTPMYWDDEPGLAAFCWRILFWRIPIGRAKTIICDGKGFDAGEISERIGEIRGHMAEIKAAVPATGFKRELMFESKREEISRMA